MSTETRRGPADNGSRGWSVLLWGLALLFPVGALLAPVIFPSRSHMPHIDRQLDSPVILITVAGLRADRLHHLGYPRDITPSLDSIAEHGTTFLDFYSSSNDAAESAAAILSARCPTRSGLLSGAGRLVPDAETLPQRFADADYTTTALIANPELEARGLQLGFHEFRVLPGASADVLLDAALDAIRSEPNNRSFVWVDLGELLEPYGGAALDLRAAAPGLAADAPPGFGSTLADYDPDAAGMAQRGWDKSQLSWLSARYDAALSALDAAIGRFTQALWNEHRLETLTLCVTGTRGACLDDRTGTRKFTHGVDLYEHSIRVPCLFRLPAQQARGQQSRRLGQSLDLGPTLVELGTKRDWKTPLGKSLAQAIRVQYAPNRFIAAEGRVQPLRGGPAGRGTALRPGAYKLILDGEGKVRETFKLSDDPQESQPVQLGPEQLKILLGKCAEWTDICGPR